MKNLRILHTGDLQIGKQQYSSFERTRDFAAVLPQIAEIAEDERVDLIVLGGDIFDSATPDAFSEKAFRKFVDMEVGEQERHIDILAIGGNHEHPKFNQGGGVNRIEAVTDGLVRPGSLDIAMSLGVGRGAKIAAADWMPASKLPEFLAALPPDLDILVMHQSCEGFIPSIGVTELKLAQLQGKARLVLLGDLHIQKTITLEDGTIVVYPGSTELCSTSEPLQKSVSLIDYDLEDRKVLEIRQVPLKTRKVLKLKVFDELGLASADLDLRANLAANPLTFIEHNSAVRPLLDQKLEEWRALGLSLIFPEPTVEIKESESYLATRESADREMEEIIGEALQERPEEAAAAAALWKTPGASKEIIAQLEREIRKSHE